MRRMYGEERHMSVLKNELEKDDIEVEVEGDSNHLYNYDSRYVNVFALCTLRKFNRASFETQALLVWVRRGRIWARGLRATGQVPEQRYLEQTGQPSRRRLAATPQRDPDGFDHFYDLVLEFVFNQQPNNNDVNNDFHDDSLIKPNQNSVASDNLEYDSG